MNSILSIVAIIVIGTFFITYILPVFFTLFIYGAIATAALAVIAFAVCAINALINGN
jgi:hypothetical protein